MIADNIAKTIYQKMYEHIEKEGPNSQPVFVVYIENRRWYQMMGELRAHQSPAANEVLHSYGKTVLGFSIHRVLTEGHGIKIFEA